MVLSQIECGPYGLCSPAVSELLYHITNMLYMLNLPYNKSTIGNIWEMTHISEGEAQNNSEETLVY